MNARRIGLIAALTTWAIACEGQLLTITIEQSSTATIKKGTLLEDLVGDFGFGEFTSLDVTGSQELANQGVQPGDISDVRLASFDLSVVSPADGDLSFIESFDVFIEAPDLPRVRIAFTGNVEAGVDYVNMELEDVDLTDYVVSKSLTISTDAEGNRPSEDTTVEANFALDVGVTTQGACNYISGASGPNSTAE